MARSTLLPILTVRGIGYSFDTGSNSSLQVVKDVSFTLERREILSLIGPSGSGKSTILRMLAGIIEPDHGEIHYWDGSIFPGSRPIIPIVEQTPALLPWRTVLDNIALFGEIIGADDIQHTARRMCSQVGLGGFESYKPDQLSGGMQTRVSIARALSVADQLVVLDEPFSNLDELTRFEIIENFARQVREQSISAVVVGHNIEEATYIGTKVAILSPRPATICNIKSFDWPVMGVSAALENEQFRAAVKDIRELCRRLWRH